MEALNATRLKEDASVTSSVPSLYIFCQYNFFLFPVVNGGPLSERYQLAVIRFHWGSNSDTGSEHAINGQKYPLEVV